MNNPINILTSTFVSSNPLKGYYFFGGKMKDKVKKQIWLTNQENNNLSALATKTCLTEAEYLRMLLRNRIPKDKPDAEFYEVMNQINEFSERLQVIAEKLREGDTCSADILQEEIRRWNQFQLAIEERFLAPEKVSWL